MLSDSRTQHAARLAGERLQKPDRNACPEVDSYSQVQGQGQLVDSEALPALSAERLFGLDFVSSTSIREISDLLVAQDSRDNEWRCVVTPNVDHLIRYQAIPEEYDVASRASIVLPDGMPIVWASHLFGRPLAGRLTGADLFMALWASIIDRRLPVLLVVSSQDVAARLRESYPQARCIVPPMFETDDTEVICSIVEDIDAQCTEVDARFLIIGISMPKHHALARELRQRWEGANFGKPTVLLMGQSPEFAVGLVRRAPRWMQRCGLEWVWRLSGDPRRLAKRYLIDDARFIPLLWKEGRSVRRFRRSTALRDAR